MCVEYHTVNSLLLQVVKAQSKAPGVLSIVLLTKIDELYAMLNGSTIYSSLDCTSEYFHIALSPEHTKESTFVCTVWKV